MYDEADDLWYFVKAKRVRLRPANKLVTVHSDCVKQLANLRVGDLEKQTEEEERVAVAPEKLLGSKRKAEEELDEQSGVPKFANNLQSKSDLEKAVLGITSLKRFLASSASAGER